MAAPLNILQTNPIWQRFEYSQQLLFLSPFKCLHVKVCHKQFGCYKPFCRFVVAGNFVSFLKLSLRKYTKNTLALKMAAPLNILQTNPIWQRFEYSQQLLFLSPFKCLHVKVCHKQFGCYKLFCLFLAGTFVSLLKLSLKKYTRITLVFKMAAPLNILQTKPIWQRFEYSQQLLFLSPRTACEVKIN